MRDESPPPRAAAGEVGEPLPRFILRHEPVPLNAGRRTVTLSVTNTGDRPVQVGSHYHFFEANRALRFERGDTREVELVQVGGAQRVVGFSGLADGSVSATGAAETGGAYRRALAR